MVSGVTFFICSVFWNLATASLNHGWEPLRAQLAPQPQEAAHPESHDIAALHFRRPGKCCPGHGSSANFTATSLWQPPAGARTAANHSDVLSVEMLCMRTDKQGLGPVLPGMWRSLGEGHGAWSVESRDTPAPEGLLPLRGTTARQGPGKRHAQGRQITETETQVPPEQAQQRPDRRTVKDDAPGNQGSIPRAVAQAAESQSDADCQRQSDSNGCLGTVAGKGGSLAASGAVRTSIRPAGLCASFDGADWAEHCPYRGEGPPQARGSTRRGLLLPGKGQGLTSFFRSWLGCLCGGLAGDADKPVYGTRGDPLQDGRSLRHVDSQAWGSQPGPQSSHERGSWRGDRNRGLRRGRGDGGRGGSLCTGDSLDVGPQGANGSTAQEPLQCPGTGPRFSIGGRSAARRVSHPPPETWSSGRRHHCQGDQRRARQHEGRRSQGQSRCWQALCYIFLSGPPWRPLGDGGPTGQVDCPVHSIQFETDFVDEHFAAMLGVQHVYEVYCSQAATHRYMDPRLHFEEELLCNHVDSSPAGGASMTRSFSPQQRFVSTFRGGGLTMATTADCPDEVDDFSCCQALDRALMLPLRSCLKGSRCRVSEACTGHAVGCTYQRRVCFPPAEPSLPEPYSCRAHILASTAARRSTFKVGSLSSLACMPVPSFSFSATSTLPASPSGSLNPGSEFKVGSMSSLAQIPAATAAVPSDNQCPAAKSQSAGFKVGSLSNLAQARPNTIPPGPSAGYLCYVHAPSRPFHGPLHPGPSEPHSEPPSLLSVHQSVRPSLLTKAGAEGLQILPESLGTHGRLTLNAEQLRLCSAIGPGDPASGYYTAFDRLRHSTVRKSRPDWTAADFLADAALSYPEAVACVQFLQPPLPELPQPQLTLTPPGLGPGVLAVAVDMRRLRGHICTVVVTPGCDKAEVFEVLAAACPEHAMTLSFLAAQDAVFLQDATGVVRDVLPLQLDVLQWLSLQLDATCPLQGAVRATIPEYLLGPTTGTTTFALPASSSAAVQTVSFVLVGGGTIIRLVPQPWNAANVIDSLTEMLYVLALQGRMPERPQLQLAAATPKLPARHNTYMICFLVFPEGPDIHILQDHSVDGSLLQGFSVDAGTRPVHMLSDAHARRGYAAYLNGLAHTSANRELATGDLVQIRQGDYFAEAVPPGRLYHLLPDLRFFALPVPVPAMQALTADPLSASLQVRAKEALKNTLRLRMADRRLHFGTPSQGGQPIIVLGPSHPALHLQMDQALTPGFQEAVNFLLDGEYLPAGTTFADPLVLEWTTPVFISIPPGSTRRTLLFPSPHFVNYLQVSVPPRLPIEGIPLPVRRGYVAAFPPNTASDYVIEERRDPAASRPSSSSNAGTSLLQLHTRLSRLAIPTPLGRRRLVQPVPADNVPSGTAQDECPDALPPHPGDPLQVLVAGSNDRDAGQDGHFDSTKPAPLPGNQAIQLPALNEWASCWHAEVPFVPTGAAKVAIQHRHPSGIWAPTAIHAFTDGSRIPGAVPGWAVAIFEECTDGWCTWLNYLGSFRGTATMFAAQGLSGADHNIDAEAIALAIASTWALGWPSNVKLHVWCDCKCVVDAAIGCASPQLAGHTRKLMQATRCLWQALECRLCPAELHWIPSHVGTPPNELADQLAKYASKHQNVPPPDSVFRLLRHKNLRWLWHILAPAPGLPAFDRLVTGRYEPPDDVPADCLPSAQTVDKRVGKSGRPIGLCTFNVQTLKAKKDLLRQQFATKGLHLVFLQETRLPAGTCNAQDYIEIRSPCQRGNLGCAIWVACDSPLGKVRKEHCKPLFADERLLIVRLEAPAHSCYLISGHAPHTGHSEQQCDSWWEHLRHQFDCHCRATLPVYVGIDSNGQVGSRCSPCIGPHAADVETANGSRLHGFCEHAGLCVPATFASASGTVECRDPRAYTWISPKQTQHRIDYVLLPIGMRPHVQRCQVLHDLETGGSDDHFPACLTLQTMFQAESSKVPTFPRLPVRTVQDLVPYQRQVATTLQQAANIPWECNVHQHVQEIDRSLWQALQRQPANKGPRRPYVTSEAWQLMQARKQHTREMRHAAAAARRAALLFACRQWAFSTGTRPGLPCTERYKAQKAAAEARYNEAQARKQALFADLRRALLAGKAAYIEAQAQKYEDSTKTADSRALFAALRFFRPAGKKVFKSYEPLTLLRGKDGEVVQTYQAQQELHRQHFADQEAGHSIKREDYLALCQGPATTGEYDLAELPDLLAIEQVIREARDGRAPGPSGIPTCVWKAFPGLSAKALLRVYMKAHMRLTEPIQYRCTKLTALIKKAGLAAKADSYRSIALLDPSAKFLHRLQRPGLLSALAETAQPLQQGCLPGSVATALTHVLLAKMRAALAAKQSTAIIFLDLTAAYYRLLRQAITGEQINDEVLCQLLERLHVPAHYVAEVADFARHGQLLATASPHLRRVLASTYRHTLFVLDGSDTLTYTQVGSRPGDSVSDVLFSLALVCVVDEVRSCLRDQGMPDILMPIWADDLSLPLVGTAEQVPAAVTATATALHHACHRRAMCPNYAPGKTEALVSYAGPGSKKAAKTLFSTGCGALALPVQPAVQLRCVLQYCHLGTMLSAKCRPTRDLHRKLGFAKSVASQLAKKVLRREAVPIQARGSILDVLATSRAHYGVAIWGSLNSQEAALWAAGHGSLYRCLVRPRKGADGPCFPSLRPLCAQVLRPTPEVTMRLLRLDHLRLIAAQQQEVLLQALQQEADASEHSWLATVEADITWLNGLWQQLPSRKEHMIFQGADDFVEAALHFPGKVKGLLRRAKRQSAARPQPDTPPPDPAGQLSCLPADNLYSCHECDRSFPDLHTLRAHQWSQHRVCTFLSQHTPRATCSSCLTRFWTRSRLLRHVLHDAPRCGHQLLAQLHLRSPSCCQTAQTADTIPPADLPAVRVPGPLLPCASLFSPELLLHLQSQGLDGRDCSSSEFLQLARSNLSDLATASTETLDALTAQLNPVHAELFEALLRAVGIS